MKLKIILILLTFNLYSQKNGIIRYGFINALGMGDMKGQESQAYMIFNNARSYYVTAKDSLEKEEEKYKDKVIKGKNNKTTALYSGIKVSPQGDQVLYDLNKKTILSNLLYGNQIYIKETSTKIEWKITKESKKIGKFNSFKATGAFRGRFYTAWFTREIPIPFGPWKLNGLPGLILEAYDKNKNVYWGFKSINYPIKDKQPPTNIKKSKNEKDVTFISYSDFKKVQLKELELSKDKNKIMAKEYPSVKFIDPKIDEMFIECE